VAKSAPGGRWDALHGPPRIPSTLPPTYADGRLVEPQDVDEEHRYCADLERRLLEFELDPVNFFRVGGRR